MMISSLRIATWNVLLFEDEYDSSYGCPISVAFCNLSENNTDNSIRRVDYTKQRQQRIWNRIERLYDHLDVLCLQEVNNDFLSQQNTTITTATSPSILPSNWTMIHRSDESVILLSKTSRFQVIATYNVTSIPNLSGSEDVPMVVLQPITTKETEVSYSFLVGSVHVRASVTNMTAWYTSAMDAICNPDMYNNTLQTVPQQSNENMTAVTTAAPKLDWMQNPVAVVLAGDFNHNLTITLMNRSDGTMNNSLPSEDWALIGMMSDDILIRGTSQKEYNWMGNFDGFMISSPSFIRLSSSDQENTSTCKQADNTLWLETSNVSIDIKGFMPKVVQGFVQGNQVQESAQFALASINGVNSSSNFMIWNGSQIEEHLLNSNYTEILSRLHLLFSPSSNFSNTSNDIVVVPESNPVFQTLSDHLLVTASFNVMMTSPNTSDDDSIMNSTTTINTSTDNPKPFERLSPVGWVLTSLGTVLLLSFLATLVHKYRRTAQFNRVSMTAAELP
jgi:hypothetical protein